MTEHYYTHRTMQKCLGCGAPKLTWAEHRRQYGRALKRGLTPEEAKKLMPRCQKCMTTALGEVARQWCQ
jgi:hypothetical protein